MKLFFLTLTLVMAPLSFASYHGEGGNNNNNNSSSSSNTTNNSSGGYGGSDALAIVGVVALVGGLAYYFTRNAKNKDENSVGLTNQNSYKSKRFEIDFQSYDLDDYFNPYYSNGLIKPRNDLQINFRYTLN